MKKLICFLVIGLFSCQKEDNGAEHPASDKLENMRWTTYEGRVPLNEKTNLYMELALLPADRPGEGSFTLHEWLEADFLYTPLSSFEGKYSTLYGETPAEAVTRFHNSAQATMEILFRSARCSVQSHEEDVKAVHARGILPA